LYNFFTGRKTLLITDAQVHLWAPEQPNNPWPTPLQRPPHRPHGFSAEEMLAEMDAAKVDRAVVVPPNWIGDNNETALEAAARYPDRFAVVGRLNFKGPHVREQLSGWLAQPHMLGVRATFHTRPYSSWLDDGTLDWFWADCERLSIPVMALVPGMVQKLRSIVEGHPHLKILIPHMGCVTSLRAPEVFSGLEDLLGLARYPGIFVMVSSVPNFSKEHFPFADLQPFLKRIFDRYGPKRMLWGADLTRLASTYRECVDQFQTALDFLTSQDREWILGKSLVHALSWPEAASAPSSTNNPEGKLF
jgi:predicted TIM-barrel fold metal-dependent hydrolase